MKLKILYTITQGHWGGAQKYVADLALFFAHDPEYEITVACGEQSEGLFAVLQNSSMKTIQLRHLVRAINPLKDVLALNEIIDILKTEQFDIVHANSSKAGFLTALAHAWLRVNKKSIYKTRCAYTAHGWIFMEPLMWYKKFIYLFMEQVAARMREATIVLSQKEKNIGLRYCAARENSLYVIPNGIDCARIHFFDQDTARENLQKLMKQRYAKRCESSLPKHSLPCVVAETSSRTYLKESFHQSNQRPWVGTIANLYKTKGIDVLIRAASVLHERDNAKKTNTDGEYDAANARARNDKTNENTAHANPYFFVIGEGPEREHLEHLIQKLNLSDSFFLVGTLPYAARYLKAFNLYVLPSLKEGFPYTLLEASCAGIPIIASDVGAIPEIIQNGENGLIVPHGDSQQLAKAIQHALTDHTLYEKLQTTSPQIADKFSFEKMIEQTKTIYFKLKK